MGMSVCLVLIMLVADQKNNDRYNTDRDKIYRITHNRINTDDFVSLYATTALPLAEKLNSEYAFKRIEYKIYEINYGSN